MNVKKMNVNVRLKQRIYGLDESIKALEIIKKDLRKQLRLSKKIKKICGYGDEKK